ncbi:MAG: phosphoribosyltransferase [Armatimonadetes bacterium]|nr:phosphoribosyltransferase [Armatimonadota bacterium]
MFEDRTQAGRRLADALGEFADRRNLLVLGLPRGGVPVAAEVASTLKAPLDVLIVRKVGLPWQKELAIAAVASGGARAFNRDALEQVDLPAEELNELVQAQLDEVRKRERLFRGDRPFAQVKNKIVILVDDGLATGSTMRAAIRALRPQEPAQIVVAVPVAPPTTCRALEAEADKVVCLEEPESFMAIGLYYHDFRQVADEEVRRLLARSDRSHKSFAARHRAE